MTFRLAIIRPNWVLEAWKNRHDPNFSATIETFTKQHRLKAFEGQKVCFFGFPEEEQQHMIDVLRTNGGIPTDLEDPECSHVVSVYYPSFPPLAVVCVNCSMSLGGEDTKTHD